MKSSRQSHCRPVGLYALLAFVLVCFTFYEPLRAHFGGVGYAETQKFGRLDKRQADNATVSSAAPTSSPAQPTSLPPTTTTPVDSGSGGDVTLTTTVDPPSQTTTPAANAGSGDNGNTGGSANTPAAGAGDGSSNAGNTPAAGAAPAQTQGSSGSGAAGAATGSNSGSGGNAAGAGTGDTSGGTGASGNGAAAPAAGASGDPAATAAAGAPAAGTTPAGAATSADGAAASPAAPASATDAQASADQPVTGAPTQITSAAMTVIATTGKDGKTTLRTSRFKTTLTTRPVSSAGGSASSHTGAAGASATDGSSSGAQSQKKDSGGMSTGAKAAVGVLVPLLAILGGGGLAAYLIRKRRRTEDEDVEKPPSRDRNAPGPRFSLGSRMSFGPKSLNPLSRFSSLKIQNVEHPDHQPINQPTLPAMRTPQMSMVRGAGGAALPADSASMDSDEATVVGGSALGYGAAAGAARRANSTRTYSTISSVSAYSEQSRYSQAGMDVPRSISPPPPLPEIPTTPTKILDESSIMKGLEDSPTVHPYDALGGDARFGAVSPPSRKGSDVSSLMSFGSDHPSQSPSKVPSYINAANNNSNNSPRIPSMSNLLSRPPSEFDNEPAATAAVAAAGTSNKHLSTASAISDAPVADARATQLFYPFGEQLMTPGGRIVPRPVGLNPNNINPGLGGVRTGNSSGGLARSGSSGGLRPPSSGATPRLPQLPEVQEDSPFGFDFDGGAATAAAAVAAAGPTTTTTLAAGPVDSPPVRSKATTPATSPPGSIRSFAGGEHSTGSSPRGAAAGYRQYQPNNLM